MEVFLAFSGGFVIGSLASLFCACLMMIHRDDRNNE